MTSPDPADPTGGWTVAQTLPGFIPFPASDIDGSLTDRLLGVAERYPDHQAISSPAGAWTYSECVTAVRRIASAILERHGSGPEPVAVIAAHDGPLVLAILSIIAAGDIVVVLDAASSSDDHLHAITESSSRLIICDEAHLSTAEALADASGGTAVPLDSLDAPPGPLPKRSADDPMMLAFTSGTSGSPKAGIITHGVLLNLVRGATNALGIGSYDRIPMLFPTSLAVAAYPLFLPLLNGGTLATLDVRGVGLAPLGPFFSEERITLAYMAPTVMRFLVGALDGQRFPNLRLIALGGEQVDKEVIDLTRSLFDPPVVANGYGTTETGVISLFVAPADAELAPGVVSSGPPVPGVDVLILSDDGDEQPPGTPGEIAVVSRYLFRGYWGHPELNRQVIGPDPRNRPDHRTYRTGDFGSVDAAGELTVLGRLDTKVKVRGRFVVIGDVEADIQATDGVVDAAVLATSLRGNTELIAYVTTDGSVDAARIRAAMRTRHDAYRIPALWHILDEMPRLPNGKVDRRSLAEQPLPDDADAQSDALDQGVGGAVGAGTVGADRENIAELAGIRIRLRELWESLLPVGTIGMDENFFDLGGDSLLAAQMLIGVEHHIGVRVPMSALIDHQTVRQLSEIIGSGAHGRSPTVQVQRGDESKRPRLWFVHDLQGSAWRSRNLAAGLEPAQPVWSFESPLLAGGPSEASSLATFAARYVRELRIRQPEGPYLLAGYSFGGICAYEMARQLERDGHEVAFVGVVDVGPAYRGPGWGDAKSPRRPWFGVAPPPDEGVGLVGKLLHYRNMWSASPAGALRHLSVRTGASRIIDPVRFRRDLRKHGRVRAEWRLWYVWEEHWKLASRGWDRSTTYPGRVDLFWSSDTASMDSTMGWGPLVDELVIWRYEGDHEQTLEPSGAALLAPVLQAAIDERLRD